MLGIPFFGDQHRNVDGLVAKQMMIKIYWEEFSEESLDAALHALIHEPIYRYVHFIVLKRYCSCLM